MKPTMCTYVYSYEQNYYLPNCFMYVNPFKIMKKLLFYLIVEYRSIAHYMV